MDSRTGSEKVAPRMNFVIPLVQRPRILKAAAISVLASLSLSVMPVGAGVAFAEGKKPLRVFILAGQSKMAGMPEFQGNVVNVFTEEFWPGEIDRLKRRKADLVHGWMRAEGKATELPKEHGKFKGKEKKSTEAKAILHKLDPVLFTPEELKLLEVGVSQQNYHYWGSTKFYARAGKAFA